MKYWVDMDDNENARLDRIEKTLEKLTGVVDTLANTVIAHDNQIEALIRISEDNARNWRELERQWQAYLNTLPRQ